MKTKILKPSVVFFLITLGIINVLSFNELNDTNFTLQNLIKMAEAGGEDPPSGNCRTSEWQNHWEADCPWGSLCDIQYETITTFSCASGSMSGCREGTATWTKDCNCIEDGAYDEYYNGECP